LPPSKTLAYDNDLFFVNHAIMGNCNSKFDHEINKI
jgi:hypothetical protein